jgi:hypothetical protein
MAYYLTLLKLLPYTVFNMHIKKSSVTWLGPATDINNISGGLLITPLRQAFQRHDF